MDIDIGDPFHFLKGTKANSSPPKHVVVPTKTHQQQSTQTNSHQQRPTTLKLQTQRPSVVASKPTAAEPTVHSINITNNNPTKCGDHSETKPKRTRFENPMDIGTDASSDTDDSDDEIELGNLMPLPIIQQLKTMHPSGVKSIKKLIANNKHYNHLLQTRRRSQSPGRRFPIRTVNRIRRPVIYRSNIVHPAKKTSYSKVIKLLSWPAVCLLGAYVGHNHYTQNIAPLLGQILSTMGTMSAKYLISPNPWNI